MAQNSEATRRRRGFGKVRNDEAAKKRVGFRKTRDDEAVRKRARFRKVRNKAAVGKVAENDEREKSGKGGRNLTLLAIISIAITLSLTTVSLAIYHYSGDIYLDRSRPGYLPDDTEVEEEEETEEGDYTFDKTGPLTGEVLDEYLKKFQIEVDALNAYQNPFDESALSDAQFGLEAKKQPEQPQPQP